MVLWTFSLPSWSRDPPLFTFQGFDNESGADHFISPNVIHYIRFNQSQYSFTDYVAFRSAWINHRPDLFLIHTNVDSFDGRYWQLIQRDAEWRSRIRLVPIQPPLQVFGQALRPEWRLFHGSDIARIRLMMHYGGIYLDNDVYVIRNLDKYRKFELAIAWDQHQFIGTQVSEKMEPTLHRLPALRNNCGNNSPLNATGDHRPSFRTVSSALARDLPQQLSARFVVLQRR